MSYGHTEAIRQASEDSAKEIAKKVEQELKG